MSKPFVSIIIACRNEEKFISKCLDSLIKQTYPKNKMEIFVVDGISEDKTREIVKEYSKKNLFIYLLDNPKKITPVAFNLGIKNANGEIIIIGSSHAVYKKDYIQKYTKYLDKCHADCIGGLQITIPTNNHLTTKAIALVLSCTFGVGNALFRTGQSKKPKIVDTVPFACYRKNIFERIGLFNENLIRSQDMELNMRLKKAGGKIVLKPEVVGYYYPKSTLKEFFKHNFIDGIWAIYPLKFVKIPLKIRHYIPLFFILSLLISGIFGIFFPLFSWLFLFIIATYILFSLYFSINIAYNEKDIKYLFLMPITFACRHFGYGIGSLIGLIKLTL